MKKRIIVACGTGVATSTLVCQRIDKFLKENNVDAEIKQCTYVEIEGNVNPDTKVIISSSKVGDTVKGVPVVIALPYISGVGIPQFEEKLKEYLKD